MISFKNIDTKDQLFIEKLYRSTREKELSLTNWPEDQKERFIIMQLHAKLAEYKHKFNNATYQLILDNKTPVGCLYLWESASEIRLIDIALLPEFQGKGIGRNILTGLIKKADQYNKPVTLHVAVMNPAQKLYERVGFKIIKSSSTHELMEYRPAYQNK